MSFEREFRQAQGRITTDVEKRVRAGALQLFGDIIQRTPVDTGRLRGNWRTGVGTAPTSESDRTDKSGAQALQEAAQAAEKFDITGVLVFANNLPYARVIEEGSSKQAPGGMVAISVNNFKEAMRKGR